MIVERSDDGGRHGRHMGADFRRLDDMADAADRSDQNFGTESGMRFVDFANLGNQVHADLADIVEAPDEGRNEGGSGLGRQDCLTGGEAQRHVDRDAVAGQRFAGHQPIGGQRHLDGDVARDLGQILAFADHRRRIQCRHFRRNGAGNDRANLRDHIFEALAGLGHEGRIGGRAVNQARGGEGANFLDVCGVDEEFHVGSRSLVVSKLAACGFSWRRSGTVAKV